MRYYRCTVERFASKRKYETVFSAFFITKYLIPSPSHFSDLLTCFSVSNGKFTLHKVGCRRAAVDLGGMLRALLVVLVLGSPATLAGAAGVDGDGVGVGVGVGVERRNTQVATDGLAVSRGLLFDDADWGGGGAAAEASTLKPTPLTKPRKLLKPRVPKPLISVDTGGGGDVAASATVDAVRSSVASIAQPVGKSAEASASASVESGKVSNAAAHDAGAGAGAGGGGGAGEGTVAAAQQRRPLPIVLPSANEHTKLTLQRAGLDMLRSIKAGPDHPSPFRST